MPPSRLRPSCPRSPAARHLLLDRARQALWLRDRRPRPGEARDAGRAPPAEDGGRGGAAPARPGAGRGSAPRRASRGTRGGGFVGRHHAHRGPVIRAITEASRAAGIGKRATSHTFRHAFVAHLLEDGYDIRTVQGLLGHAHVETTMIYTHVLNR